MEYFFDGIWRMDWGFGNPNLTGALLVSLMIACWSLAWIRGWGFWAALAVFAGLEICLIHTFSRGGVLGAVAGLAVLAWFAPRPWPRKKIIAICAVVWIGVMAAFYLKAHARFSQGIATEDRSITNRLVVWKSAPQMLADAPGGWGWKKAGDAYMAWYHPLDQEGRYASLVNTHLTALVEWGVLGGLGYLIAWFLALLLCWPRSQQAWKAIPFGMLAGLAVSACFTTMLRVPAVWILPALGLLVVLAANFRSQANWPSFRIALAGMAAALLLTGGIYGLGVLAEGPPIEAAASRVKWNSREPALWILVDDRTLGEDYGRTWREFWEKAPEREKISVGFANSAEALPQDCPALVIAGGQPSEALHGLKERRIGRLILLNPGFNPAELAGLEQVQTTVLAGDFSAAASRFAWPHSEQIRVLPGVGDYLPEWPGYVLNLGAAVP